MQFDFQTGFKLSHWFPVWLINLYPLGQTKPGFNPLAANHPISIYFYLYPAEIDNNNYYELSHWFSIMAIFSKSLSTEYLVVVYHSLLLRVLDQCYTGWIFCSGESFITFYLWFLCQVPPMKSKGPTLLNFTCIVFIEHHVPGMSHIKPIDISHIFN